MMQTVSPVGRKVMRPSDNSKLVEPTDKRPRMSASVRAEMVDLRITGRQEYMIDGLITDSGKGSESAMLEPIVARGQAHGSGAPVKRKGQPVSAFSPRTSSHLGSYKVVAQN